MLPLHAPSSRRPSGLLGVLLALAACHAGATVPAPTPVRAHAALRTAAGADAGTVDLLQTPGDSTVTLHFRVHGLDAGVHGVHLHAVGACDGTTATAFASAGAHVNPAGAKHGLASVDGPHAGDLPNLTVGTDGTADVTLTTTRVRLDGSTLSLLDADGTAVVVHATADDQRTDPTGNSGARVACGAVTAGA